MLDEIKNIPQNRAVRNLRNPNDTHPWHKKKSLLEAPINVNEIDQWFKSDYMLDGYDNKRAIESKELNIERKEHGIEDEHYIEDDS